MDKPSLVRIHRLEESRPTGLADLHGGSVSGLDDLFLVSDPVALGIDYDLAFGVDLAGIDVGQDLDRIKVLALSSDDDV